MKKIIKMILKLVAVGGLIIVPFTMSKSCSSNEVRYEKPLSLLKKEKNIWVTQNENELRYFKDMFGYRINIQGESPIAKNTTIQVQPFITNLQVEFKTNETLDNYVNTINLYGTIGFDERITITDIDQISVTTNYYNYVNGITLNESISIGNINLLLYQGYYIQLETNISDAAPFTFIEGSQGPQTYQELPDGKYVALRIQIPMQISIYDDQGTLQNRFPFYTSYKDVDLPIHNYQETDINTLRPLHLNPTTYLNSSPIRQVLDKVPTGVLIKAYFPYNGSSATYEDGYNDGYNEGTQSGYNNGYNTGYNEGVNKQIIFPDIINGVFNSITNVLNVEIFPSVKLWYIIGVPLILGVIAFIIGFFRGGS